jgi:hypothetical protein
LNPALELAELIAYVTADAAVAVLIERFSSLLTTGGAQCFRDAFVRLAEAAHSLAEHAADDLSVYNETRQIVRVMCSPNNDYTTSVRPPVCSFALAAAPRDRGPN